jgi:hypothetical protein
LFEALLRNVDSLGDIERYTLVSDTLGFVRNGQLSTTNFLDLVAKFGDEREQAIWSVITGGLALIEHHALAEEARPGFEKFVSDLVSPALDRLGWTVGESDTDLERKLRGDLISAMGNLASDADTIDRCRALVKDLLAGEALDPELATAALAVYARNGGPEEYETLWKVYKESTTPLDQVRYLRSAAAVATKDEALTTLDRVVDGEIRTQDGFWVFARLLTGKAGPIVWERARERWEGVLAAMPGMTLTRIAEGISALSQPEVAASVRSHFAEHPVPEAGRSIEQNLEKLDANIALRERETPVVTAYFSS